ncbi:MAG: hypothetical protein V7739_03215 [Motiliproteus sp.]
MSTAAFDYSSVWGNDCSNETKPKISIIQWRGATPGRSFFATKTATSKTQKTDDIGRLSNRSIGFIQAASVLPIDHVVDEEVDSLVEAAFAVKKVSSLTRRL